MASAAKWQNPASDSSANALKGLGRHGEPQTTFFTPSM
jgi:hypothetical protein